MSDSGRGLATGGGTDSGSNVPVDATTGSSDSCVSPCTWTPNPNAGPLGFVPTNFNPTSIQVIDAGPFGGDGGWANAPDVCIPGSGNACPPTDAGQSLPPAMTIAMDDPDHTLADLYVLRSLTVDVAAYLSIAGPRPVILAVLTTVDVKGSVTVSAGAMESGPGIGQGGASTYQGSGGSYCGIGGAGNGYATGSAYGTPTLHPLLGGSDGGGRSDYAGLGGGALEIAAGMSIDVGIQGSINAGGTGAAGPTHSGSGNSGGSGGALLLEAPTVSIRGAIATNGGGGGSGPIGTANDQPAGNGSAGTQINGGPGPDGGGGGAGRIRINTASGAATITGIVSPSLEPGPDGGSPCATQGTLN
jgi:hypothetical protein